MQIRRLVLTAAFLVIVVASVVAVVRNEPASGVIAFFATLAVIGGGVAMLFRSRGGHARGLVSDPFGSQTGSTDVINFSRLRVAGLGGLGLVVVCVGIAIALPRVGQTMLVAAVGGLIAAAVVIYFRRRRGPLDSSHAQPGGRSVLVEPASPASVDDASARPRDDRREPRAVAAPTA